jgi:hypothetical protein
MLDSEKESNMKNMRKCWALFALYSLVVATVPSEDFQLHAAATCEYPCIPPAQALADEESLNASIPVANDPYTGTTPNGGQITVAGNALTTYLLDAYNSKYIAAAQTVFEANASTIEAAAPDIADLYANMNAQGWLGTEATLQAWIDSTTQAERVALISGMESSGLYLFLADQIESITETVSYVAKRRSRLMNAGWNYGRRNLFLGPTLSPTQCSSWGQSNDEAFLVAAFALVLGLPELSGAIAFYVAGSVVVRNYYCGT